MKHQAGTSKSSKQPRKLDQNSSFKSKLRLSKGKLGEIFKKPTYNGQLIAPESSIVKFPLKKLVAENLKDQQQVIQQQKPQNLKSFILTSTPHHALGSEAKFFSDRRPSASLSPIQQQEPRKDNHNAPEISDDSGSEVNYKIKKPEQPVEKVIPVKKDIIQSLSHNVSYATRSKSQVNKSLLRSPVASSSRQGAQDSIICIDSPIKINEVPKQTQERTPEGLRRSRRDQYHGGKKTLDKREESPSVSVAKKSKIPLRTNSQEKEADVDNANNNKVPNVTYIQPPRITPSRSGQTQVLSRKTPASGKTKSVPADDVNTSKNKNLEEERDLFVNKTPRSNRKSHYKADESAETPSKHKENNDIAVAVQTENNEQNRLLNKSAQTGPSVAHKDGPEIIIQENVLLESPFKVFRKGNQTPRKTFSKDVQTTFGSTESAGSPKKPDLNKFRSNTREAQLERKRDFENLLKGLEEFAKEADKVSEPVEFSDDEEIIASRRNKRKKKTLLRRSVGKLHDIVDKLVEKAQEQSTSEPSAKTPKNNLSAKKRNSVFRKSAIKSDRPRACIVLGDDSRDSVNSRVSLLGEVQRPNIFDSLEVGNVVDVVDFSNENVPELSAVEKPWRFEGSGDNPSPFVHNLTLKFARKEGENMCIDCINESEMSSLGRISLEHQESLNRKQEEHSKAILKSNEHLPNVPSRRSPGLVKFYGRFAKSIAVKAINTRDKEPEEPAPTTSGNAFKKPPAPKAIAKKTQLPAKSKKVITSVGHSPGDDSEENNTITNGSDTTIANEDSPMAEEDSYNKINMRSTTRKNLFGSKVVPVIDKPPITRNRSKSNRQKSVERDRSKTVPDESQTVSSPNTRNRSKSARQKPAENDPPEVISEHSRNLNDSSPTTRHFSKVNSQRLADRSKSVPEESRTVHEESRTVAESSPTSRSRSKAKSKKLADYDRSKTVADDSRTVADSSKSTRSKQKKSVKTITKSKTSAEVSAHNVSSCIIPEPEANNSSGDMLLKETAQQKNACHLELTVSVTPIDPLINKLLSPIPNARAKTSKKHPRNIPLNTVSKKSVLRGVDISNIIETTESGRPKRERRPVKYHTDILQSSSNFVLLSENKKRNVSSRPIKRRKNNNNGTASTLLKLTPEQTALSLATGSTQSTLNLKSISTEISGVEILSHIKKTTRSRKKKLELDTILDEDVLPDAAPPTAPKTETTKRGRTTKPRKTTTKGSVKKSKVDHVADEQPMVFENDVLPVLTIDIPRIQDVSEIERLAPVVEPAATDLGNSREENDANATNLRDSQVFARPEPPATKGRGRPIKSRGRLGSTANKNTVKEGSSDKGNEENGTQIELERRVPEIVLPQTDEVPTQEEHLSRTDLPNHQPGFNDNGDNIEVRQSHVSFSDMSAFTSRSSTLNPQCSMSTAFSNQGDYIRHVVDGQPVQFKFLSRLPKEDKFKKVQNIFVAITNRTPLTGLFSFGYIKVNANEEKSTSVAQHGFTFNVLKGNAQVELEGVQGNLVKGESFMVPRGWKYGIKNVSKYEELLMSFTRINNGGNT